MDIGGRQTFDGARAMDFNLCFGIRRWLRHNPLC